MAQSTETTINSNPKLQEYYSTLETRLGFSFILGGRRHYGYYDHDTYWPFPLHRGLELMEDKLAEGLDLPAGSQVLDSGCGDGYVAVRMAKTYGFRIQGIDVTERHLKHALANVNKSGLPQGQVQVRKMDYHHLEGLEAESFDGVYAVESFIHATDPVGVLAGFYRVLRPGGKICMHDFEFDALEECPVKMQPLISKMNEEIALHNGIVTQLGGLKRAFEEAGFADVVVRDFSENTKPMTRLFFVLAYIPWFIFSLLGVERKFPNVLAGIIGYRSQGSCRYVQVTGSKPGPSAEAAKSR